MTKVVILEDIRQQAEDLKTLLQSTDASEASVASEVDIWHVEDRAAYENYIDGFGAADADVLVADLGLIPEPAYSSPMFAVATQLARQEFPALSIDGPQTCEDCASEGLECVRDTAGRTDVLCFRDEVCITGLTFIVRFAQMPCARERLVVLATGMAGDSVKAFARSVCDKYGVKCVCHSSIGGRINRDQIKNTLAEFFRAKPVDETCSSVAELTALLQDQFTASSEPFPHYLHDDPTGNAARIFHTWADRHFPGLDLTTSDLRDGAYEAVKGFSVPSDARYPVYLGTLGLFALFLRGRTASSASRSGWSGPLGIPLTYGDAKFTSGKVQPREMERKRMFLQQIELLWTNALGGEHLERLTDVKLEDDAFKAIFTLTDDFNDLVNAYEKATTDLGGWLRDDNTMKATRPLASGADTTRSLIILQLLSGLQVCFRSPTNHSPSATGSINLIGSGRNLTFEVRKCKG